MFNDSENNTKLVVAVSKMITLFYRFTQRNILRVYPAGNRVNSSNYDPTAAWIHGAQMVAQNMQVRPVVELGGKFVG